MTRGKEHNFLGMDIKIRDDRTLGIDMGKQLNEAIEAFAEKIEGTVSTPAQHGLFTVNEDSERLDE